MRKTRQLYLVGRTSIHLDHVESLGHFLEPEVVLAESEDASAVEREAYELMQQLDIRATQLVEGAYSDVLGPSA